MKGNRLSPMGQENLSKKPDVKIYHGPGNPCPICGKEYHQKKGSNVPTECKTRVDESIMCEHSPNQKEVGIYKRMPIVCRGGAIWRRKADLPFASGRKKTASTSTTEAAKPETTSVPRKERKPINWWQTVSDTSKLTASEEYQKSLSKHLRLPLEAVEAIPALGYLDADSCRGASHLSFQFKYLPEEDRSSWTYPIWSGDLHKPSALVAKTQQAKKRGSIRTRRRC